LLHQWLPLQGAAFLKIMQNNIVAIFSRSPVLGKVKTRLAQEVGNTKALEIHRKLFRYTKTSIKSPEFDRVFYLTNETNGATVKSYKLQEGKDLGHRMFNAFDKELAKYSKVCIVGIDCLTLTPGDINTAFKSLDNNDIVLGPATDGGYYLIGMKRTYPELFTKISWGSSAVLEETISACAGSKLSVALLREQSDLDELKDLPKSWL